MRIVLLSSEMAPVASSGVIGEAVTRLAGSLRAAGHEVTVILPLYRSAREELTLKRTRQKFSVNVGPAKMGCELYSAKAPCGTPLLLIGRDEFFDRSGLYGSEGGDYQDNAARFIFFVKAALEAVRRVPETPDVLHAHGWQAALFAVYAKDSQFGVPVVLSPHGLDFQGNFWSYDFGLTNLADSYFSARGLEFYGSMNFLKAGLLFSDAVVLPDERFSALAQTAAEGCGLESVLREVAHKIWGIPDGACLAGWDPENDKTIASQFSPETLIRRTENRKALIQRFGWEEGHAILLVAAEISGGAGFFLAALDRLLPGGVNALFLGAPENSRRTEFEIARRKHSPQFVAIEDYEETDIRSALAGSDLLLVPSATRHAQPWLPRALRYGVVPVARQCPGLQQFVRERGEGANGFVFGADTTDALLAGCRKGLAAMGDPQRVAKLRAACVSHAFSAESSATSHIELYASLKR